LQQDLLAILQSGHPMTVRQVFYRATVAGFIPKTEPSYKNVIGRQLVLMRRSGMIPYDWIADNTRWQRKPLTHSSIEDALDHTARCYRRALWDSQSVYVEVWLEKDAIAGAIMQETRAWDVPLMVTRGFASVSFLHLAAEDIKAIGKPAHLYYIGDRDPSGIHIDRTIERNLREMAPDAEIHFTRVAVLPEQIERWNLPTRPTKKTDSRSRNFEGESVEVDAIPPQQLRQLVRECITQHIDQRQLDITQAAERSEREILARLSRQSCLWRVFADDQDDAVQDP
jgi:hypothetical protein